MRNANIDVIVDLQFGSTGKGLIAGYMANTRSYVTVVAANMPNAGHTFVDHMGRKFVHKALPSALCSVIPHALIAPSAVFSLEQLKKELTFLNENGYPGKFVYIHEHATLLTEHHKQMESGGDYKAIGSTQQGSAEAMVAKLRRDMLANPTIGAAYGIGPIPDTENQVFVVSHQQYLGLVNADVPILVEGSQGYSLGLNAGFYPYCTSRDCTVTRLLSDCLIPRDRINNVVGVARTFPIRVGGTSGPGYEDQKELSWAEIGQAEERTTVTNRVRRVFDFSYEQIREALSQNVPDEIFLNFCNYLQGDEVAKMIDKIDNECRQLQIDCRVRYVGWGPSVNDVIDLHGGRNG